MYILYIYIYTCVCFYICLCCMTRRPHITYNESYDAPLYVYICVNIHILIYTMVNLDHRPSNFCNSAQLFHLYDVMIEHAPCVCVLLTRDTKCNKMGILSLHTIPQEIKGFKV